MVLLENILHPYPPKRPVQRLKLLVPHLLDLEDSVQIEGTLKAVDLAPRIRPWKLGSSGLPGKRVCLIFIPNVPDLDSSTHHASIFFHIKISMVH